MLNPSNIWILSFLEKQDLKSLFLILDQLRDSLSVEEECSHLCSKDVKVDDWVVAQQKNHMKLIWIVFHDWDRQLHKIPRNCFINVFYVSTSRIVELCIQIWDVKINNSNQEKSKYHACNYWSNLTLQTQSKHLCKGTKNPNFWRWWSWVGQEQGHWYKRCNHKTWRNEGTSSGSRVTWPLKLAEDYLGISLSTHPQPIGTQKPLEEPPKAHLLHILRRQNGLLTYYLSIPFTVSHLRPPLIPLSLPFCCFSP